MTYLDVVFHYASLPGQRELQAVDDMREVYGIRRVHFDGPNLYQSEIERNMEFLRETIEAADLARLRRYCYSLSAEPRQAIVA